MKLVMSNTNLSLEQLKEIISLKEQIASLEQRLAKLTDGNTVELIATSIKTTRGKMSSAARAQIGAHQKAKRAKAEGAREGSAQVAPITILAKKAKRKRSAEGRARIIAALKKKRAAKKA